MIVHAYSAIAIAIIAIARAIKNKHGARVRVLQDVDVRILRIRFPRAIRNYCTVRACLWRVCALLTSSMASIDGAVVHVPPENIWMSESGARWQLLHDGFNINE